MSTRRVPSLEAFPPAMRLISTTYAPEILSAIGRRVEGRGRNRPLACSIFSMAAKILPPIRKGREKIAKRLLRSREVPVL